MSKPAFEGLYHLTSEEYRYQAEVLTTMVNACRDATAELMDGASSEDLEMLARLFDLQIKEIEASILGADIETLIDIVERTQAAFDARETE